ncbi:uncharacterized protein [Procambarus clarkii]|uniref:uncharacterized protein n=1 Tax=Procambarus clarkii TaxID=6728 RepID=UPI001E677239|nr:uncharacterized protein LOC123774453 [Procambarus clarkii]
MGRVLSSSSCPQLFWLLLSCSTCCLGTGPGGKWKTQQPEFGPTESTVTVQEGQTASLPCVVLHLNDRAVTWLRRRDLHILTTGHHTYSADDRFQVVHSPGSDQWTLVVTSAQLRDSGIYECQVNTDPKLSRPVTLNVYDSTQPISVSKSKVFVANNTASTRDGHLRVEILGPRELNIEEGSSLTISCLVTSTYGPSTLVYWYHDTRMIDYASARGGIKLKIDHDTGETTARLVVEKVGAEDSGMYSCVPAGSHPASVRVQVHQGNQEAAIQQAGMNETSSSSTLAPLSLLSHLLLLLLLLLYLPQAFFCLHTFHSCMPVISCLLLCWFVSQANLSLLHCFIYIYNFLLIYSNSHVIHLLHTRASQWLMMLTGSLLVPLYHLSLPPCLIFSVCTTYLVSSSLTSLLSICISPQLVVCCGTIVYTCLSLKVQFPFSNSQTLRSACRSSIVISLFLSFPLMVPLYTSRVLMCASNVVLQSTSSLTLSRIPTLSRFTSFLARSFASETFPQPSHLSQHSCNIK